MSRSRPYPCQNNSRVNVHKRPDDAEARAGLGREMVRTIRLVRPKRAVLENVAGSLDGGHGVILRDLAGIGYNAEWDRISAEDMGAPHERERIVAVAYPGGEGSQGAVSAGNSQPPRVGVIAWSSFAGTLVQALSAHWKSGAGILGMDDGISLEVDRIKGCGNAILPQKAQIIGEAIAEAEGLT